MTGDQALIARVVDEYARTDPAGQSEQSLPWLLHGLVIAVRPRVVVEIGSFKGQSAMSIAAGLQWLEEHPPSQTLIEWNALEHPAPGVPPAGGTLYCIDPVRHPDFDRMLAKFGHERRIRFIEKRADDVDPATIPDIDLLFIDGDHSYRACKDDFDHFAPRVRPGGLILIHDVFPDAIQHHAATEPWWGPNLFVRQLRDAYELTDCLVIDTHFAGLAIFRKRAEHIDYPFLSSKGLALAVVQFYWRRIRSAPTWLPTRTALWLSGGRTDNRRWRLARSIARRLRPRR